MVVLPECGGAVLIPNQHNYLRAILQLRVPFSAMDKGDIKPKVEQKAKKGHQGPRHYQTKSKFKAPTPGLEDVVFTTGLAKDAAGFEENKKKLGRHMAVTFKMGGTIVKQAIETMKVPAFSKPADLPQNATKMEEKEWEMSYEEW